MKRFFDISIVLVSIPLLALPLIIISILIRLNSKGPAIHWSKRVGRDKSIFIMPKYRTMKLNTPQKATHLLDKPDQYLTAIGRFLRKSSLDELPQLWSILIGDMSFVGPRPALFNQYDLIELRDEKGINTLRPGLTGWAQINGRDDISIKEKVALDSEYMKKRSNLFDILIIIKTISNALRIKGISH